MKYKGDVCMKMKLFMHVDLDVDGDWSHDKIKDAALKVSIGDIETGLFGEDKKVYALESNFVEPTMLMGIFVDIIKRGEA